VTDHIQFAALQHLTALDISKPEADISKEEANATFITGEELEHLVKLTSLRHLSLPCKNWFHHHTSLLGSLRILTKLTSLAFLNISPWGAFGQDACPDCDLQRDVYINELSILKGLDFLQSLPLREVHVGLNAGRAGAWPDARDYYNHVWEALEGSSARLGLAILRGTRGWCTQEEARRLLCSTSER
jgi:hypothetical protein